MRECVCASMQVENWSNNSPKCNTQMSREKRNREMEESERVCSNSNYFRKASVMQRKKGVNCFIYEFYDAFTRLSSFAVMHFLII